jgi:uncharacterized protein YnzC (UPF0291/DUF896 family)
MSAPKRKKCKICKDLFTPTVSTLQATCTKVSCILQNSKAVNAKLNRLKIQEMREKLKTRQEYLKDLQTVFNAYIRERDKMYTCISCDKPLRGKYDAGHYFSVGSYPNLRFNEANVHGQCVECNQHKHGNLIEYGAKLIFRIGMKEYEALHEAKNGRLSLSVDEIQEQIKLYKTKLKQLKHTHT